MTIAVLVLPAGASAAPYPTFAGEISDYVSYSGGDTQHRVNYDVSGMSASPSGNSTGSAYVHWTLRGKVAP